MLSVIFQIQICHIKGIFVNNLILLVHFIVGIVVIVMVISIIFIFLLKNLLHNELLLIPSFSRLSSSGSSRFIYRAHALHGASITISIYSDINAGSLRL
jgi:hypothetical protein